MSCLDLGIFSSAFQEPLDPSCVRLCNFRMQLLDSRGRCKKTKMIGVHKKLVWNYIYKP